MFMNVPTLSFQESLVHFYIPCIVISFIFVELVLLGFSVKKCLMGHFEHLLLRNYNCYLLFTGKNGKLADNK